jgi:hypothetical protein
MEPSGIARELSFLLPLREAKMKPLGIAIVCAVVLYGVDAYWFNGVYFTAASHLLSQVFGSFR